MAVRRKAKKSVQPRARRQSPGRKKGNGAGADHRLADALAQQAATAEILKVIARSPADVQPVFDCIVRNASTLCKVPMATVILFDGAMLHLASSSLDVRRMARFNKLWPMPIERAGVQGIVVRDRKLANVRDVESDKRVAKWAIPLYRSLKVRSGLWVPMIQKRKVIGLIAAFCPQPDGFDRGSEALLKTFADQAVIAIQNARAFNESKEALERQTATAEILKVIASSPSDVQPVFDAIARSATQLIGGFSAAVVRVEGDVLQLAALTTTSGSGDAALKGIFPLPISGQNNVSMAVRTRAPRITADVESDPGTSEVAKKTAARARGWRAGVAVPMLRDGQALGAINVTRREPGPFGDHHVKLLQTFADQAVIAIENVRLFNETKEALERQTATAEILKVIASSPSDVQPVLDAIVNSAARLVEPCNATIVMRDGNRLSRRAIAGPRAAGIDLRKLDVEFPLAMDIADSQVARAILESRTIDVPDTDAPDVIDRVRTFGRLAIAGAPKSFAIVPLLRDGIGIGAIGLTTQTRGFKLNEKQLDLVKTFADQAVIAIENVRLFNETKEALERQTATAEILKVIASSPSDVQPVFDAIAWSAKQLLGGHSGSVRTISGDKLHLAAFTSTDASGDEAQRSQPTVSLSQAGSLNATAVRTGRPAIRTDIETDPDMPPEVRAVARSRDWRSNVAVPMLRDGVPIGTLNVTRREPGSFSSHQIRLLETFADQAVIAIENVRLFNETKESLERQTATAEILKVIASSPSDVQPVFESIAERATALCAARFSFVTSFDGELIHMRAHHGPSWDLLEEVHSSAYPMKPGVGSMASRAVLQSVPIQIPEIQADTDYEHKDQAEKAGFRSGMAVPMLREGQVIGAITVARGETGAFPQSQVELLKTFADQAVIAIENVRLFNETKEALERQTATAEILKVIASSPADVQPVFESIVQSGARLFPPWNVAIIMRDGEWTRLKTVAGPAVVNLEEVRKLYPLPFDPALSRNSRAMVECRIVEVTDTEQEAMSDQQRDIARKGDIRSATAVPLVRDGTGIGVISLTHRDPGMRLEAKQLALAQTFADQAVIAIENVRLFNETKEALERQTATAEILKVIASSPSDVQPVFDAIVSSARRLLKARGATVSRREGDMLYLGAYTRGTAEDTETERLFPVKITGQGPMGRAILDRSPAVVADVETFEGFSEEFRQSALRRESRSMLSVPLLRGNEAIGAINVSRSVAGAYSAHEMDLLKSFADQAVIAIENVRLFNETKEALERQTATAAILKAISQSPTDTQPVFETIVNSCLPLFGGMNVALFLRRGDFLDRVAFALAPGTDPASDLFPSKISGHGTNSRALLARQLVQVADVMREPEATGLTRQIAQRMGFRSIMAAPLLREGEAIGTINVFRAEPSHFSAQHEELLRTVADQAVIAIENVRLFKELQAREEALTKSVGQLTALGEVGQALSSTLELDKVLQTIVSRAVQLTALDAGAIYEYDERSEQFSLQAAENMDAALVEGVRQAPIRKGDGATGRMAVTREPIQVPDVEGDSYHGTRKDVLVRAGYRAVLAVPLLREGHLLGALQVFRKAPGEFAPEVVELLKTFGTQSAMAIQNARLFREIAEKGKQLEEASRHKSNFLASMSHELRTPLNAILGFNEMILGQVYGEVPTDMQEPLTDIQTSGKHLLRLINNVLDLAKIEAGRMELSLQDYSVHDTVGSVHSTLRPLAAEKGLEFLANVPNDVPLAYGDGGRMAQCLMNLAGNSLKFTKAGKVEISAAMKGDLLVYKVTDTGIGIPPDKIDSLFTEFKQTDATIASEYGGTGLGLSISRKFVEMHGGRIWVESELGKGSAFIIEIPLRVTIQ